MLCLSVFELYFRWVPLFFTICRYTLVCIGNQLASLVFFLSAAMGFWSSWPLCTCLECVDGFRTSQITLVS